MRVLYVCVCVGVGVCLCMSVQAFMCVYVRASFRSYRRTFFTFILSMNQLLRQTIFWCISTLHWQGTDSSNTSEEDDDSTKVEKSSTDGPDRNTEPKQRGQGERQTLCPFFTFLSAIINQDRRHLFPAYKIHTTLGRSLRSPPIGQELGIS